MTPSEYFRELVEPTIAEFEANPASVRHAYAACVFAYHFADAVAVHLTPDRNPGRIKNELAKVRNDLTTLAKEFRTVEGVATMAKHIEVMNEKMPVRPKTEDTHVSLGEKGIWTDAASNIAPWTDATGTVGDWHDGAVKTRDKNGNPVDMRDCVQATRRAIERYLAREGLP